MYIDEQSKINLNGVPQFVSIRAETKLVAIAYEYALEHLTYGEEGCE